MYVCMYVLGFLIGDLLPSVSFPSPVKNFRSFEPHLHRLRLYADLVRGVLHLWTRGVNAILVVEGVFCPGVAAMKNAAPYVQTWNGRTALSNFAGAQAFLSCFTSFCSN